MAYRVNRSLSYKPGVEKTSQQQMRAIMFVLLGAENLSKPLGIEVSDIRYTCVVGKSQFGLGGILH